MSEIGNNILDSHYSTQTKVKPSKRAVAQAPAVLPKHKLFSNEEAEQKINSINNDIYSGTVNEKKKKEFNHSLYFKIFGGVALAAAGIAGINKIKSFFKSS